MDDSMQRVEKLRAKKKMEFNSQAMIALFEKLKGRSLAGLYSEHS